MKEQNETETKPDKRPAHRPDDLLTPTLQGNVCKIIEAGNYFDTACAFAGVSPSQYRFWLRRGREELESGADTKYTRFLHAVDQATAIAEIRDLERIDAAAEAGMWQASAWKLERRHHDRWGRSQDVNIGGQVDSPITIVQTVVKPIEVIDFTHESEK